MIKRSKDPLQSTEETKLSSGTTNRPCENILLPEIAESKEQLTEIWPDKPNNDKCRVTEKVFERYDIEIAVVKHRFSLMRYFTKSQIVTAHIPDGKFGPSGYQVTWNALAKIVVLVVSYAIPANRLSVMLTNTYGVFSSAQISRMLDFVASIFVAIYLELADQLAEASSLRGDDKPTKVYESLEEKEFDKEDDLISKLNETFGSQSLRKDGSAPKKQLNLSVICGKTVDNDPQSWIFFFRTHIGSVGNLLSKILSTRRRKNKKVRIQADLSSSNRVDSLISQLFDVFYAGCCSHARRPFWRWRSDDEGLCYYLLRCFALLARLEKKLVAEKASPERIIELRQRHGKRIWKLILDRCQEVAGEAPAKNGMINHWPKDSPLGKAVRYIIRNYDELTIYLGDDEYFLTNNICERMLRREQMMLMASKYRRTKRGRAVFDILQTMLATCSAAQVQLKDYLPFLYQNRDRIPDRPEDYTPYAFSKLTAKKKWLKKVS